MKRINNIIHFTRFLTKWIGMITIFVMMVIVTIAVILRGFSNPFTGQVEAVELLMLTLIMVGLSYTQSENAHIDIGLIVDKFPIRVQAVFDMIASVLMIAVCFIISFFNFEGFFSYVEIGYTSSVLSIPLFPFKLIVAIGMLLWGLEGLLKLIRSFLVFRKGENLSS
ncbi:TRAP transporter small permease [Oceanobacillus longus]|uniref:TRAP transporter small permease n=1 Tax=Oceanobacillus longus TaxID=930120 RepID=A0ABV8H0C2_9BACI